MDKVKLSKIFRWAGRILASLALAFLIIVVAGGTRSYPLLSFETLERVLTLLVLALTLLLTWWHDLPAAILLLTISVFFKLIVGHGFKPISGYMIPGDWPVFSLPSLIAGIFLLIAWLLSLKHGESKRGVSPS